MLECPPSAPAYDGLMARDDESVWRLDELAHAGQEHLDALYVAGYDRKSSTDWSEEVADLRALGIGSASTVVDLGAGTGAFAEAIAPHVREGCRRRRFSGDGCGVACAGD